MKKVAFFILASALSASYGQLPTGGTNDAKSKPPSIALVSKTSTNTDSSGYVTNANLLTPFTLTNSAGNVVTDAVLVKLMPNKFLYNSSGTMGILRLDSLSKDLQEKFGYDPAAAAQADMADDQKKARQEELWRQQNQSAAQAAAHPELNPELAATQQQLAEVEAKLEPLLKKRQSYESLAYAKRLDHQSDAVEQIAIRSLNISIVPLTKQRDELVKRLRVEKAQVNVQKQ